MVGPGGLLAGLTKQVLEAGLEVEVEEHLGYEKHAAEGRNLGNSRNGTRSKTVLTEIGPVEVDVPRDRDSSFDPQTVRKGQRRLDGVDSMVISLTAKGLTTGEVEAHLAEVYSTTISRELPMRNWLIEPGLDYVADHGAVEVGTDLKAVVESHACGPPPESLVAREESAVYRGAREDPPDRTRPARCEYAVH